MKILISYFSMTGNTEKVARAIYEEASRSHKADLITLENLDPEMIAGYEFIFIGSPIHALSLSAPVKDFLHRIKPGGSNQKMAGFITHGPPTFPEEVLEGFAEPIKAACREKHIEYKGLFNCQGHLEKSLHEITQERLGVSDEQWQVMVKQMAGHPNEDDLAGARAFAREVFG